MTPSRLAAALGCSAALALGAAAGYAQQVYRIVGPDGKVTFSDRAPDANAPAAAVGGGARAAGGNDALPYSLRQVASRFPVTLYTSADCPPCASARNLLVQRGIPFTEKTVNTNEDLDALRRLSGSDSLPFGTIGGQQLKGFSDLEWSQYLDAAGYPKQSQLPPSYRRPAPSPLVAAVPATPAAPATARAPEGRPAPAPAPAPVAPTGPTPTNPAGIVF